MSRWVFEPGHTAAEFAVRHMMVTFVRGHFKGVEGMLEFDPDDPARSSVEVTIRAANLWSGDRDRDQHLKSADFLDVANHPTITFRGDRVERVSGNEYKVSGALTIRGVTRPAVLDVTYLGKWRTPYNQHRVTRIGFKAKTRIDRHDFGVSWNAEMEGGGVVVGREVLVTIDAEAILESELPGR